MDQSLVIAILVGVIVFLLGILFLLVAASAVLVWTNRRLERQHEVARRDAFERARARPPITEPPTPTPISRMAVPPEVWDTGPGLGPEFDPYAADEAATEVIGQRHIAAFYDYDEDTGTTEVRSTNIEAELHLDDTDETTKVGRAPGRWAAKKK